MAKTGPTHLYIPDTQIKPGTPLSHIEWAARYAAELRPDRIIFAGDWYDFASLSYFDKGKRKGEGRRIKEDIEIGDAGALLFDRTLKKASPRSYDPEKHFTDGNHEERLNTAINNDPALEGMFSLNDLAPTRLGWRVHKFLRPIEIHGITYMHYCPLGPNGRVSANKNGAPSARIQIQRMMRSTVCGHRQGKDIAELYTPGRTIRGVIAGSFYQHEESYLTAAGETYWRGVLAFKNIRNGNFDLEEMSIESLAERFG